jgi:nucleoside-diphosphate-sugar epimerase
MTLATSSQAGVGTFITTMPGNLDQFAREVTRQLVTSGHRVTVMTDGADGARDVRADGALPAYPDPLRAGELRSAIAAAKAEVVINLAPQAANHLPHVRAQWDERLLAEGTQALLEAAAAAGVQYLIHTSYAFVGTPDGDAIQALMRAAVTAERRVLASALATCVLRFGFLYGAESAELVGVRDALRIGRPITPGVTTALVAWTTIADAVRAIQLAVEKRPARITLNVVDDTPATTAEFMRYFAESQGYGVPGRLPLISALMEDKRQAALMKLNTHANNTEAKAALGWSPRFSNYRQGIDDMLLTWRASEAVGS